MKLINIRFILAVALSLILGIVISYVSFLYSEIAAVAIFSGVVLTVVVLSIIFIKSLKSLTVFLIIFLTCLVFCFGGAYLFSSKIDSFNENNFELEVSHSIDGKITKVVYYGEDAYCYIVEDLYVDGAFSKEKIRVYESTEYPFELGTRLIFTCYLNEYSAIYEGDLNVYRLIDGVKYYTNIGRENVIELGDINLNLFEQANYAVDSTLKAGLDEDAYSVARGLLLGNTDYMEPELLVQFRSGGIAHIFAVSGLHIGFLALALSFLLRRFPTPKFVEVIVITAVLIFYSGICGFSSSSLRAAIMFSTLLALDYSGGKYDGLSALALSSIIILLVSPFELFGVGFQLSFAVVAGITLLGERIKRLFKFFPDWLSGSLSTIISAQAFGMPICLIYFDAFSSISVLTNLIFVPIVSAIFYVLFVSVFIAMIIPFPTVILFISNYLLKGINFAVMSFDFNIFLVGGFSLGAFVIVYYLIMLFLSDVINMKKVVRACTCIALSLIFALGVPLYNLYLSYDVDIKVMGSSTFSACLISSKDENVLIVSDFQAGFSVAQLRKAMDNEREIDKLILLGYHPDINSVLTNVNYVASVKEVDYYGFKIDYPEKVFVDTNFNFRFNEEVVEENYSYKFLSYGKVIELTYKGQKIFICGNLTLSDDYKDFDYGISPMIISVNYPSDFPNVENAVKVAYRKNNEVAFAEGNGILAFKLRGGAIKPS